MKTSRALAPVVLAHVIAASAQGLPDDRGTDTPSLDTVTVNARRSLEQRFLAAGSLVVVDRKDIEELGAFSVTDVLRQLPSTVVTTSGDGSVEIRMRGMDRNATQLLIDGQRVSSGRSQLPLDQLPAEMIERIEVVRAPTAEFSGATGGTINIVLRQATVKRETSVRVSDNHVWGRDAPQAFFSRTGPLGAPAAPGTDTVPAAEPWAYFLAVSNIGYIVGSDIHREGQDGTAPTRSDSSSRYRRKDIAIVPRLSGKLGAADQLTLRATYNRAKTKGDYQSGGVTSASAGDAVPFETGEHYFYDRDFLQAGADWVHRFKGSKLETTLAASRARETIDRQGATTLFSAAGPSTTPSSLRDDRRESLWSASSKLTGTASALLWTLGTQLEKRKLDVANVTSGTATDLEAELDRYVLWGQNEWDVGGNTLTAGLRAETLVTRSGFAGAAPSERRSSFLQPSLHLRVPVNDDSQFRANVARVTRQPRVWDLIDRTVLSQGGNSIVNPDTAGNPDLKAETSWTLDAGYERRLPQQGQVGANVFVRRISDTIASQTLLGAGRWVERRVNVGDATVWGIELDAKAGLTWAGLGRDWTLAANASMLQSRMTSGSNVGARIPGQPRYTASVTIAKPIRRDGGLFGGGTLSVTGPADFDTSAGISGRERARTALDLYIGNVHKGLGYWRIGVFNITDAGYKRRRSYANAAGQAGFSASELTLTPRLYLTVGTQF